MPEKTSKNENKKGRLGRGIGSLLGGSPMADAADVLGENKAAPKVETPSKAPIQKKESTDSIASAQVVRPVDVAAKNTGSPQVKETPRVAAQAAPTIATKPVAAISKEPATATQVKVAPINEESQIWSIGIDKLTANTQQPRQIFAPEALRDLAASIKEKGVLQPIVARRLNEKQFEIIAGERRWRAAQLAGLHEVPVILKKVTEQASFELAIIENIQRENLNPIEEAEAYDRLMNEYKLTQQQVADKLGKERSTIANTIRLLSLPRELTEFMRKGELSSGHAKVLLGLDNTQKQLSIGKQIVSEKLSVRATEKLVARAKLEARGVNPAVKDQAATGVVKKSVESLAAELQKLIGSKVTIDYLDAKGKINIHFYGDDQLNQIVEKIREAWEK